MTNKLQKSQKLYLWPLIVTLTFDIESLYLVHIMSTYHTEHFIKVSLRYDKKIVKLWTINCKNHLNLTFELLLWHWPLTKILVSCSQHVYILDWTFLPSITKIQQKPVKFWPINFKNHLNLTFDLLLWPWPLRKFLHFVRNMSTY